MNLIKLGDLNVLSLEEIRRKPDKKYGKMATKTKLMRLEKRLTYMKQRVI